MAEDPYKRSQLRIPNDLYDQVVAAASAAGRSMNNEIVTRLYRSFDPQDDEADKWREVANLARRVSEMHEASAERMQVSALATNLLIARLVPHLYEGQKLPSEVQEIIDRSKAMIAELRAYDVDSEMEQVKAMSERITGQKLPDLEQATKPRKPAKKGGRSD